MGSSHYALFGHGKIRNSQISPKFLFTETFLICYHATFHLCDDIPRMILFDGEVLKPPCTTLFDLKTY